MITTKNIRIGFAFSIFLLNTFAFAEKDIGNGGKVVACPQPDGSMNYNLLDYERTKTEWNLSLVFRKGKTAVEIAKNTLESIKKLDPIRAELYLAYLDYFASESKHVSGTTFFPVQDSSEVGIPEGCHIELVVNQRETVYPSGSRYIINAPIWDKLDEKTKAGLMLHEIIYRDAIAMGQQTSDGASYLNAVLASHKLLTDYDIAFAEYKETLIATGLTEISSFPIKNSYQSYGTTTILQLDKPISSIGFHGNRKLKNSADLYNSEKGWSAYLEGTEDGSDAEVNIQDGEICSFVSGNRESTYQKLSGTVQYSIRLNGGSKMCFRYLGTISSIEMESNYFNESYISGLRIITEKDEGKFILARGNRVTFDNEGNVSFVSGKTYDSKSKLKVMLKKGSVFANSLKGIGFYPNGQVLAFELAKPAIIKFWNFSKFFKKGTYLTADLDGWVQR